MCVLVNMICSWFLCSLEAPAGGQCVFWPWVRVQRQGTVGRRAGGGDGPDAARSLRLLTIIQIEPAYCQDPPPPPLFLSFPISLTLPLFLSYFRISTILFPPPSLFCFFFHVSAFILSISFHLYNSLPLYPL